MINVRESSRRASTRVIENKKMNSFTIQTPCIESVKLANIVEDANECNVYLKLENIQPTGSFKIRGISNMILKELERGKVRLVASSGGNAGLAAAYVTKKLNVPLDLYIPINTKKEMLERLRAEGANVILHGKVWDEADEEARKELRDPSVGYISPFDHPDIWEGHSSLIMEASEQMSKKPDLVILSVGGGGLLLGVSRGMEAVGWNDVPILAMETVGADCLHQALLAGKLIKLRSITSIASSLGALMVAEEVLKISKQRKIISKVVTDEECVEAVCRFLDDHCMLVEPSCGASLAAIYAGIVSGMLPQFKSNARKLKNILVIVCGGVNINLNQLNMWKTQFSL
ncbi:hypothetical protein HELRODRAFT_105471 [Helobdella robusta]|uniref:L-serine ammonia-lyase n=1 Tax=Helobdella robusta TaxID=6412 RepID=T1EDV2_HELRO|nr:hypothetical protein HELRODRAFT_105471 [Helobdella robusta]ESO12670.1 hypothetical protein HELRODRAFT_105471 [Helobdella robusta]